MGGLAYDKVEFLAPVFAGDYIEAHGRHRFGNTSRTMEFEARKVIIARPDVGERPRIISTSRSSYAAPAQRA